MQNRIEGGFIILFYGSLDSIDTLRLSMRLYNALSQSSILTIQDLLDYPKEDIINIKNLGKQSLLEILPVIDSLNSENTIIEYGRSVHEEQQTQSFIGCDGNRYYDIVLDKLALSARAVNCLKNAKVNYFSELLLKTDEDLIDISNMGKKTLLEIQQVKSNTSLIPFKVLKTSKNITYESIYHSIFTLLKEKIDINAAKLYEALLPPCSKYLEENIDIQDVSFCLKDTIFMQNIYELEYIKDIFKSYVLSIFKENMYGCSEDTILKNIPNYFNSSFTNDIIGDLLSSNKIEIFGSNCYIAIYPSFVDGAKKVLSDREYDIFIQRIDGKTLDEIGKTINVTKERVRQLEVQTLRKLDSKATLFKEDIYSDIFRKYSITCKDFTSTFKSAQTYHYLSFRYNSKDSKLPLKQILEDKLIPIPFKRVFEKTIYKNCVKIGKNYVPCTRADISNHILKTFATEGLTFDEYCQLYFSVLEDIGKKNDPTLSVMDSVYRKQIASRNIALWKYKKRFRYYNMEQYDFSELLNTINLNQYNNVEYSAQKFLCLYPDVMQSYDIRDEYELHNLLKKVCKEKDYPTLNFKRMPTIEFGKANRDNQVGELLFALAPISRDNFAKEYENVYGVGTNTVLASYMKNFDKFFYDGMYNPILRQEITFLPN